MANDNGGGMAAHDQTYTGFMSMLKWGTIGVAVIVCAVVLIIAR